MPASRFGSGTFSAAALKMLQEVITLIAFAGFSLLYLQEKLKWNYLVALVFILGAVSFKEW